MQNAFFLFASRSITTGKQHRLFNAFALSLATFFVAYPHNFASLQKASMAQDKPESQPSASGVVPKVSVENQLAQVFEPREFASSNKSVLKYRLLKPAGYVFGKKYPLIVFLHGAGERGDDNAITLKHAAKEFANEARRKQYPAYVLIPQCPKEQKWSNVDWSAKESSFPEHPSDSMGALKELIDEMVENAGIDTNRIYLTGLSMGGYGTWDAVARYPNFFAAAAPICGGGDPNTVERFSRLPIWCFHGAKDSVVPVERTQQMVAALQKVGSPVKYTEYPELNHDSWTETYANADFYQWLFAQQKSSAIE